MNSPQPLNPPYVCDGVRRNSLLLAECLSLLPCMVIAFVVGPPIKLVILAGTLLAAAAAVEYALAVSRNRRADPRCAFNSLLFTLMLSPDVAAWQAAIAMAAGVAISEKRIGAARLNCLHPALTAYVVLHSVFPVSTQGAALWGGHFAIAAIIGMTGLLFMGLRQGRLIIAAAAGFGAGMLLFAPWTGLDAWGSVAGGLCFGLAYIMMEPRTGPFMKRTQWIFGVATGIVAGIVPLAVPESPEALFLVLLLCNALAPFLDDKAVARHKEQLNEKPQRRLA